MGWFEGTSTRTPTSDTRITKRLRFEADVTPWTPLNISTPGPVPVPIQGPDVRPGIRLDHPAVGVVDLVQVAVELGEMQSVAEHEGVRNLGAAVPDLERNDAPDGPVEQGAHVEPAGPALGQLATQVVGCETGVDHVLDHDDVPPGEIEIDVLQDPHPATV